MREFISISAILIAFVYFVAFGSAVFMALEGEMHWLLAFGAFAGIILLRLWPLLPVFAFVGADQIWGWPWWVALLFATPIAIYIVSHYWVRLTDHFRRPAPQQGV